MPDDPAPAPPAPDPPVPPPAPVPAEAPPTPINRPMHDSLREGGDPNQPRPTAREPKEG